jgi:hypothetical protein
MLGSIVVIVVGGILIDWTMLGVLVLILGIVLLLVCSIALAGLKVIKPNEALVLTLFGKYYGTLREPGFYFVNPFASAINPTMEGKAAEAAINEEAAKGNIVLQAPKKDSASGKRLSMKALTLNNGKQKINDLMGNPIEIGVVVIWRVANTAKAVFNVDNYMDYVITQLWIENTDLGNVKFFKTTEMPWHWALFDTDASMRNPARNSVEKFLRPGIASSEDTWSRLLVSCLLQNPQFRDAFLHRMAWQLENVWNEETVVGRIDWYCQLLKDDIEKECARWSPSVKQWEKNVQEMRDFASRRSDYFIRHVQNFFGLTDKQMRAYGFEV